MKQVSWFHLLSYVFVSVAAVGLAFVISLRFVAHAHSQAPMPPMPQAPAQAQTPAAQAPGGGKPSQPLQESAAAVAAEVQGFLEPFIYDSKNRRDPFQVYAEFQAIEPQAILSPLQRYDVDEFKLVGIMWDIHDPKAMFVDPEREVHMAGRNESIGKRNGYIATIREGEVVIVESFRSKDGEMVLKPKVLRMER